MNRPIVALDIGSTKVACAIGLPHEHTSGFEWLAGSVMPYPALSEAWCADPLMVSRTIEQALEATAIQTEFHRALIAISHPSLASERIRTAVTLADEPVTVRAQDLARLQAGALHQVLGVDREPLLVERLGCDGNGFEAVRDPRGLSATRLFGTFHIVTMPLAARRAVVQVVESAGLEVARLLYTLPAIVASVAGEEAVQRRVLVLDAGGLTTDIGLFVEGTLQGCAFVPCGGLTLATAIAKALHVTMDQAIALSLEGTSCRKGEVRAVIEHQWDAVQEAARTLLEGQPRPDAVLIAGRGSLIDGFAEWMERAIGIPTMLARSGRLARVGDVARQVALSPAVGLLELATRTGAAASRSPHLLNRLLDRTRTILTEYF